jgi:hypothetical protein
MRRRARQRRSGADPPVELLLRPARAADVATALHPAAGRPHLDVARSERVLESLREVGTERAELVAGLRRLMPAWHELRSVLNGLNGLLGP